MKKYITLVILIFSLAGCGSGLTSESFDDLGNGMTQKEVTDTLGKPSKTISKQTEVTELVEKKFKTAASSLSIIDKDEYPEDYEKFYDAALKIADVKLHIESNDAVIALVYNYSYKGTDGKNVKSEKELYFYDDKLIYY